MLKLCGICGDEYIARWGNTPAVCDRCALLVAICPSCWAVELRADDPAQLALFDRATMERRGVWWSVGALLAHHFANRPPMELERLEVPPWPERVTAAERRRYPYH